MKNHQVQVPLMWLQNNWYWVHYLSPARANEIATNRRINRSLLEFGFPRNVYAPLRGWCLGGDIGQRHNAIRHPIPLNP